MIQATMFALVFLSESYGGNLQSLPDRWATKAECEVVRKEILQAAGEWKDPTSEVMQRLPLQQQRLRCIQVQRKTT